LFFHGTTAHTGPSRCPGFTIKLRHTTRLRTPVVSD